MPEEICGAATAIATGVLEMPPPPPTSTVTIKKTTVQVGKKWRRTRYISGVIFLPPPLSLFPSQILEELCQKSNWGSPLYTLHSTTGGVGEDPLFLYKVRWLPWWVGSCILQASWSRETKMTACSVVMESCCVY